MKASLLADALKSLASAGGVLLATYIPSGMLLGLYLRTQAPVVLLGVAVVLAGVLFAAMKLRGLRLVGPRYQALIWSALFGVLALLCILCFTFVYGSFIGIRVRSIIPPGTEGAAGVAYGLAVASMAAVSEEIAFRGIIQSWLHRRLRFAWALSLTSALFCLWHVGNPIFIEVFPFYLLVGVALGIVYELTRTLVLPILLHLALDAFTILGSWLMQPVHLHVTPGHHGSWLLATLVGIGAAILSVTWALPRARDYGRNESARTA